jgi:adenylylsulfate kinase-like enzyme
VPVLWLCGPPGVGKSTVSWQLFTDVARSGIRVAFADTDQLGMCLPAPPEDVERQRVKARSLGALIPNYQAAGARCLIVNGFVDPAAGVLSSLIPHAEVTTCRLRASTDEVVRRFIERHGRGDDLDRLLAEVREEAAGLDQSSFADACVDTTGVPADEVARLVKAACRQWPGFSGDLAEPGALVSDAARPGSIGAGAGGDVLLVCGPAGVGKSTVGFQFYLECLRAGLTAGYVDLDQIGFLRPADPGDTGRHRVKARNLAAMWRTYRGAGATHLVASGPIEDTTALQAYAGALPAATITVCRLRAGKDELTKRILARGAGGSWPQPGDPLRGQPAEALLDAAARATEQAAALDSAKLGSVVIDTDRCSPAEAAALIGRAAGWP